MNREKAKEFDTFSYNGDMDYIKESSVSQRIDEIFDYFENKSCKEYQESEDEIVHSKGLILQGKDEEELWANCYLAAVATNAYANPPQQIADMAISELRKRLKETNE